MVKYDLLEQELEKVCAEVQKDFFIRFKKGVYISAGGAQIELFINELQSAFEIAAVSFIKYQKLEKNAAARKKVLAVTKQHAKKCIEEFSKIQ